MTDFANQTKKNPFGFVFFSLVVKLGCEVWSSYCRQQWVWFGLVARCHLRWGGEDNTGHVNIVPKSTPEMDFRFCHKNKKTIRFLWHFHVLWVNIGLLKFCTVTFCTVM